VIVCNDAILLAVDGSSLAIYDNEDANADRVAVVSEVTVIAGCDWHAVAVAICSRVGYI
jgi:hypothetical protein